MSVLLQAGMLPPTDEYDTVIRHYPGINAHPPWGTAGKFWFAVRIYENGALVAEGRTEACDEKGCLQLDVGKLAEGRGRPVSGMFIVEYHHAKDIPVELYAFHIHKATGCYTGCNVTPFIGDKLYPQTHSDQMENTLFWPGLATATDSEPGIAVVNPYDERMGFQVHLIRKGGPAARTGMLHLQPKRAREFRVAGLFPGLGEAMEEAGGRISLCISSQYKLVAYVTFRNRDSGILSMMDHLHTFCLA